MRFVVASLFLLSPPVLAVVFVKATSSPRDANVGGGLYLIVGVFAGLGLSAFYLWRTRLKQKP